MPVPAKDGGSAATAEQVALNDAKRNGYVVKDGNSLTLTVSTDGE